MKKSRDINLDVLRCIAALGVVSVHFFLNAGFYQEIISGRRMVIMTGMRTLFMYCVPVFILLTGYLMNKKTFSRKYYKGILHTLGIYVIVSLICILYRILYWKEEMTLRSIVGSIFNFTGDPYAWYIEMYIGLFLVIPFLNVLYHGMKSKREKQALILTFFILITLPSIFNISGRKVIPDWWTGMWPVLYYFAGCYLREYPLELSARKNIVLLGGVWGLSFGFNVYRSYGNYFERAMYDEWYGWENVLISILLFSLVKNMNLSAMPDMAKRVIQKISELSLGIYLCSWISDQIVYKVLNENVTEMAYRLNYFPVVVGAVFLTSVVLSFLADAIYMVLFRMGKVIGKIVDRKQKMR